VDRPHRGERLDLAGLEGLVNRLGPMETQVAALSRLAAHGPDQILDDRSGAGGGVGRAGAVVPVHPVESLAVSPTDPGMNRGLTDAESVGDLVPGSTAPDGGDDGPTASGVPIPLRIATSWKRCGFSAQMTTD
jgi:hypothetical protein